MPGLRLMRTSGASPHFGQELLMNRGLMLEFCEPGLNGQCRGMSWLLFNGAMGTRQACFTFTSSTLEGI